MDFITNVDLHLHHHVCAFPCDVKIHDELLYKVVLQWYILLVLVDGCFTLDYFLLNIAEYGDISDIYNW